MKEIKAINRLIKRHGADVKIILRSGQYNIKAFIQTMRYKNKMYLDSQRTSIGMVDESCYLYIGPADYALEENTNHCIIQFNYEKYMVVKYEKVYIYSEPAYSWAILRRYSE